jgi:hypothetical protein
MCGHDKIGYALSADERKDEIGQGRLAKGDWLAGEGIYAVQCEQSRTLAS